MTLGLLTNIRSIIGPRCDSGAVTARRSEERPSRRRRPVLQRWSRVPMGSIAGLRPTSPPTARDDQRPELRTGRFGTAQNHPPITPRCLSLGVPRPSGPTVSVRGEVRRGQGCRQSRRPEGPGLDAAGHRHRTLRIAQRPRRWACAPSPHQPMSRSKSISGLSRSRCRSGRRCWGSSATTPSRFCRLRSSSKAAPSMSRSSWSRRR